MKQATLAFVFMLISTTPTASSSAFPSDLMAEVASGWKCGACKCNFAGLDYAAAVDLRFEKQERKNQCQKK